jgi:hypothetical protein
VVCIERRAADIHGISMNYVDSTNLLLHLYESLETSEYRNFEMFTSKSFPQGLDANQQDVTFGEFKSTDWAHRDKDFF